jgi:hypothetical protein
MFSKPQLSEKVRLQNIYEKGLKVLQTIFKYLLGAATLSLKTGTTTLSITTLGTKG